MRSFKVVSITMAAGLALAGCASAPKQFDVQNTRVYPESRDVVWERIVATFARNNMSIKTIEKASGIIAADRMFNAPSGANSLADWADCGKNILEVPVTQTADLNVFVRSVPQGTSVSVNTRFVEVRRFADRVQSYTCNSSGHLEQQLLDRFARD